MNFIFISPNFPDTYFRFCHALKNNGVNVLGIGDQPYDELRQELKEVLTEYYYVNNLINYNEKYEAVKFFEKKYGKIDYIESNNEFWLYDDAKLRTDFLITTGPNVDEIKYYKNKSLMKEIYKKAGIKTARYILVSDYDKCKKFINEVSYPVIVKPDSGVGAAKTHSLKNDDDLKKFFESKEDNITYIMEEFIDGQLISFDGVCSSNSEVIYPTHHVFLDPIMDVVNELRDTVYYTSPIISKELLELGQKVIKAFKAKSRFFHLEFFILNNDKEGLGKKGDYIALEVNMRVPGGYTPDLINFAYSIDIYQIWADVIVFDENRHPDRFEKTYCCYVGRRNYVQYLHCYEEIMEKYRNNVVWTQKMPDIISDALGNYFFMAKFKDKSNMNEFIDFLMQRRTSI